MRKALVSNVDRESSCSDWTPPKELEEQFPGILSSNYGTSKPLDLLEKLIEGSVIPRLVLDHRRSLVGSARAAADATAARLAASVDEFAELVVNRDAESSSAYIEAMRAQGITLEALFQDLLAPAARRLGVLWEEDINDFMDVSRGLAHLSHILHDYSSEFSAEARVPISNRRALLMPMPGEQHTFGISMVGEYFKRAGWRVWGGPPRNIDDILELVDGQWFDMVGLSISAVREPQKIASQISQTRKSSHNKNITVLIGGSTFLDQPDLVGALGADATASDGHQAVRQVSDLIGPRRQSK